MRALPTRFSLNKLATTLTTNGTQFTPGQTIAFSGDVAQVTTVATGTVQNTPVTGSTVTLKLVDANGSTLASTQATTNLQGRYAGSMSAPGSARGNVTLIAESSYQDAATALGTKEWYGRADAALVFPGNIAPTVTLVATPDANRKSRSSFLVSVDATVSDLDGRADVTTISLTLLDARGRVLGRWSKNDFKAENATTWRFSKVPRVTGTSPWTVTITAEDSAGQLATTSKAIK